MLFQENEVLSSISSFLLSNPDCVRRAADWEQRQKIKKGYQWVTFFEWKRSLFLDLLPCPWKRHRKRKQWIKVKRMVMLTITSVFPFRPCVWDNLSMWEFLGYFSEGKGFVSVPCGFMCHVYNDKLNRARGQVWEVAHIISKRLCAAWRGWDPGTPSRWKRRVWGIVWTLRDSSPQQDGWEVGWARGREKTWLI